MERALLSVTLPLQYLSLPPSHSHSLKPLFSLSKFSFSLSHPLSLYVSHSLSPSLSLSLSLPPPHCRILLILSLVFHSPLFPCLASYYHGSSSFLLSFSSSVGWMYVFPVDPSNSLLPIFYYILKTSLLDPRFRFPSERFISVCRSKFLFVLYN